MFIAVVAVGGAPVNPNATLETRALFDNLMQIQQEDRLIFGQYNGTYDGRAANYVGDIYDMTGVKPGMNEWHVPYLYNFNYSSKMARLHEDYAAGMLIGFFWRMYNPITGGEHSDTSDGNGGTIDIDTLLPGGIYHTNYLAQLDMFVEICDDLPKINGNPIPVFLRFLPEMSRGHARWYKEAYCSPEQYVELWQVAHDYLVLSNGLNNILWQFNPNDTDDASTNRFGYKEFYPGHDLVDICGRNTSDFDYLMGTNAMDSMRHAIEVAEEGGKIVAISQQNSYKNNGDFDLDGVIEEGEFASVSNWWTDAWLDRLVEDDLLGKIAFSCAWKNNDGAGESYFLPFSGHEHESNFVAMCSMAEVLLAPDLPDLYAAPALTSGMVWEFVASEGLSSGDLIGQQGWGGDAGAFIVDTNAPGFLSATGSWKSASYGPGLASASGVGFKIGAKIRFTETVAAVGNKQMLQLLFNGADASTVNVSLKRQSTGNYILNINEDSGAASTQKGSSITASVIGTTNGSGSVSSWLYLELALSKGSTPTNWTADAAIYNLETDPGMQAALDSFTHHFVTSNNFADSTLVPGIQSAALDNAQVSNLTFDSITLQALHNTFAQWVAAYGLLDAAADPDGDGLNNLTEYALGGNPTNANDDAILPTLSDDLEYIYRRRTDDPALVYWIETTTNLISNSWETNGLVEMGLGSIESHIEAVTNAVGTDDPQQYIRLRILIEGNE
jgi:mannan endo-1,4-beta-mannosidase